MLAVYQLMWESDSDCRIAWSIWYTDAAMLVEDSYTPKVNADEFDVRCKDWIFRIAQGEEAALEALYSETLDRVYGVAKHFTRDHSMAEEVVVDVFHQVWLLAKRYDSDRGRPLAWLLSICRSRALDRLRKENRDRRNAATIDDMEDYYIDDDLVDAFQKQSHVGEKLKLLSPVQRNVLMLAFFRDLSQSQIADHLGLPLGTVKTYMRRSLLTMREGLADHRV